MAEAVRRALADAAGWASPALGDGVEWARPTAGPAARRPGRVVAGLRSLAGPVAAVVALYALFIAARLALHGGDPSAFVAAGDIFADAAHVPPGLHVRPHSSGYDGQAYYRLALDPFTLQPSAHGIRLDNPAYRQQRILYPLLAWALSLGRPALLPWALIAINLAGLAAIAALGAALARSFGRPAWWGALPALYPGFAATLALDLTEIVEPALLLGGLLLLRRGRYAGSALCLTLAVLGRETALLVPAALGLLWAIERLRKVRPARPAALFVAPLATYLAWQGLLWSRWHTLPFQGNNGNFGAPLAGLLGYAAGLRPATQPADVLWLLEMAALAAFGLGALAALCRGAGPGWLRLAWLLTGLLAACLGRSVWLEDLGFLRALADWYVLGTLLLMADRGRRGLLALAPSLLLLAWMWLTMAFI